MELNLDFCKRAATQKWSSETRAKYDLESQSLASYLTKLSLELINNSLLRKSINKVESTYYSRDKRDWDYPVLSKNALVLSNLGGRILTGQKVPSFFSIAASFDTPLEAVSQDTLTQGMLTAVERIISAETEAVATLGTDPRDVTIYIKKHFELINDPTVLNRRKIGFFGWEEIAVVANNINI